MSTFIKLVSILERFKTPVYLLRASFPPNPYNEQHSSRLHFRNLPYYFLLVTVAMPENPVFDRPHTTVILAMSVDGKIADVRRSPARFSSAADQVHLEKQIALVDGVLFGAGTLRAYGTTMRVSNPQLLKQREQQGKPLQPLQIVCSGSGDIDPQLRFFRQPVPRWLLTTAAGALRWQKSQAQSETANFEQILVAQTLAGTIDWINSFQQLTQRGIECLGILGGGELVASLLAADLIDEFWLTVCPLILGGMVAPTPVGGEGFSSDLARRLELLEVETLEQEVFLHYRLQRP